jgi:hypothetical protein
MALVMRFVSLERTPSARVSRSRRVIEREQSWSGRSESWCVYVCVCVHMYFNRSSFGRGEESPGVCVSE